MNKLISFVGGSSDIARSLASMLLEATDTVLLSSARDEERVEELVARGAELVAGDALDEATTLLL